jgi:hypothetical protein
MLKGSEGVLDPRAVRLLVSHTASPSAQHQQRQKDLPDEREILLM